MSSSFKPQRPTGGPIKNPRNTRIAGFEALLDELNKQQTATTAATADRHRKLKDVSNTGSGVGATASSARRHSKGDHESASHHHHGQAKQQPSSARDHVPTYAQGNYQPASNNGLTSQTKVPKAPAKDFLLDKDLLAQPSSARATASSKTQGEVKGLSPSAALIKYSAALTDFEQEEIKKHSEVFYVGDKCARKNSRNPTGANNGHDDSKGDYRVVMDDHVAYRYQLVSELGKGSFGQVSKALDHKTGNYVAVKIIKNKKKFHDQALVEVNILKHLNDGDPHDRCHNIRMVDSFLFRNHMCIIFALHGMNLYEMCKAQRFQPVSQTLLRSFAKQLLLTLHNNAKEKIVHCDLKPENILLKLNSKTQLAVIDYGSACFESQRLYTYIQSRFYRAPEVMLGIPYTTAIDTWSLGCILAEMANGYPLFPGESEVEQMQCLLEVLGMPPKNLLDKSPRKKIFFDSMNTPRLTPNSRGRVRRPNSKDLKTFLKTTDDTFVDFIRALLTYDPEKRATPMQAMQHNWLLEAGDGPSAHHHSHLRSSVESDFTSTNTPRGVTNTTSSTAAVGSGNFARQLAKGSAPHVGQGSGLLPKLPKRSTHW